MTSAASVAPKDAATARAVFVAWERLRVLYNAALLVLVLVLGHSFLGEPEFLRFLAKAAVIANVCYCAGPLAEWCLTLLGAPRRLARIALFGGGLVLACWLCALVVIPWPLRG